MEMERFKFRGRRFGSSGFGAGPGEGSRAGGRRVSVSRGRSCGRFVGTSSTRGEYSLKDV